MSKIYARIKTTKKVDNYKEIANQFETLYHEVVSEINPCFPKWNAEYSGEMGNEYDAYICKKQEVIINKFNNVEKYNDSGKILMESNPETCEIRAFLKEDPDTKIYYEFDEGLIKKGLAKLKSDSTKNKIKFALTCALTPTGLPGVLAFAKLQKKLKESGD